MRLKRRYKLFKINSAEICFEPVWFIPFGITSYALSYYSSYILGIDFPSIMMIMIGIIASFSYFFFSTIHELAHVFIAKQYGLEMRRIALFMGRMDSHISSTPENWWQEFSTAIFGSLINALFAFLFVHIKETLIMFGISLSTEMLLLINYLIFINVIIAVFNLIIPALPLDGGRILRSLLWAITKDYTLATTISLWISIVFGIFVTAFSLVLGGYFYVFGFIGIFILYSTRREQKKLRKYGEI